MLVKVFTRQSSDTTRHRVEQLRQDLIHSLLLSFYKHLVLKSSQQVVPVNVSYAVQFLQEKLIELEMITVKSYSMLKRQARQYQSMLIGPNSYLDAFEIRPSEDDFTIGMVEENEAVIINNQNANRIIFSKLIKTLVDTKSYNLRKEDFWQSFNNFVQAPDDSGTIKNLQQQVITTQALHIGYFSRFAFNAYAIAQALYPDRVLSPQLLQQAAKLEQKLILKWLKYFVSIRRLSLDDCNKLIGSNAKIQCNLNADSTLSLPSLSLPFFDHNQSMLKQLVTNLKARIRMFDTMNVVQACFAISNTDLLAKLPQLSQQLFAIIRHVSRRGHIRIAGGEDFLKSELDDQVDTIDKMIIIVECSNLTKSRFQSLFNPATNLEYLIVSSIDQLGQIQKINTDSADRASDSIRPGQQQYPAVHEKNSISSSPANLRYQTG